MFGKGIVTKAPISLKVCFECSYISDASYSIAKISQKACKYIHQADLHVQDSFLCSVSALNSADASKLENTAENCSLSFGPNMQL